MKFKIRNKHGVELVESTTTAKAHAIIVILHGYGANMKDLAPLAKFLDANGDAEPPRYQWVFPNGLREINFGYGMTGHAWFDIAFQDIEYALRTRDYQAVQNSSPNGMEEATETIFPLLEMYSKEARAQNIPFFIGGFSQGAMLACELFLKSKVDRKLNFAGALLFSPTIVRFNFWNQYVGKLDASDINPPIFISHGESDPVLPFDQAKKLSGFLKGSNMAVTDKWFSGGHEIPLEILKIARDFISLNSI